jgi:NAD(P)-dependent dehydrogenase (short-subunit alcohol dehydrogenase family)
MSDWIKGQVALVTGGGSGLGRAVVERFVREGARVGVLEKSPEKAETLRADLGEAVCVTVGDVTSWEDNRSAVAATVAAYGRLDTFIGNAGIWDYATPLVALPPDAVGAAFDEVFGVNVKGYLLGAKAAVSELASTSGSIIFTISNAGFHPDGGGPLYVSSKHAVVGLLRQLAYELAPKIRVNGVAPGGIASDLRGPRALGLQDTAISTIPGLDDLVRSITPLQLMPDAADYTGHYVLLASKENSRTTTGAVINCDGGLGVRGFQKPAGGEDL